ncbi:uncharacterized protein LOC110617927 [Manihot esculenta]|uniref:Uncharacterized protein n=1 Tax=Manihot esculenta TaxID=3983 RepID=A0A2C9WPF1_MANES|nr:uncharacterized protein LOC110617927 [Manihot esculenta]OAY61423.1 hypothetical protein MANES_01G187400v8 [Manihot esculenta]
MAETPSKRLRDEAQIEDVVVDETNKRHKSYNHILSLLEEEEDEPTQDLSSLITTLQQELSSESTFDDPFSCPTTATVQENPTTAVTTSVEDCPSSSSSSSSSSTLFKEDEEDDKERVIRHLLEASDDELGIPNREAVCSVEDVYGEALFSSGNEFNEVDGFSLCNGLWEFEDANANYYALLQSELFL